MRRNTHFRKGSVAPDTEGTEKVDILGLSEDTDKPKSFSLFDASEGEGPNKVTGVHS